MNQNNLEREREPSGIEGKERPRNTKVMKFIEKTFNFLKVLAHPFHTAKIIYSQ